MPHKVDPTLRPLYADIYMAIRECWLEHGYAPSSQELRDACLCSLTTVHYGIIELVRRGYVTKQKFVARNVRPVDFDLTISVREKDPWDALSETKFFHPPDWSKSP